MLVVSLLLAALLTGSLVYCLLILVAVRRYLAVPVPTLTAPVPISILKPLAGVDEGLEENLLSFFSQRYPEFEILAAVREPADPAVAVFHRVAARFPNVPSRLLFTGEPPYPNAKVFSLDHMFRAACYDLLVMSDSDIRVTPDMLSRVAAEFEDPQVGMATCPYRAVAGPSFWSLLEAIGMNTEFWGSAIVARMLEGMRFAVGPTIVARRDVIEKLGGFNRVKDYLAEDFVLGKFAAEAGCGVILSRYVIEHRIGSQRFWPNAVHRVRWCRSTRRSRPAGYVGEIFTNPLPLALALLAARPQWWPLFAFACLVRAAAAWAVAGPVLHDPVTARRCWLVPLQDLLSFVVWLAGFFGNTIAWRGRQYHLHPDGTFTLKTGDRRNIP
jgi:ceramide glucosyltransferase